MLFCGNLHQRRKSFHERVVHNADGYNDIWEFIDTNIKKWNKDKYYA
ncbi:MAG: hypothetical protein FWC11_00380 [Firmicutes bacterium]|nr:hypothetical protein [Bacillota bacterium]